MGQHDRQDPLDGPSTSPMLARNEHARAIKRVLDPSTNEVVGWLYEWNTGQVGIMWKDEPRRDVIYD